MGFIGMALAVPSVLAQGDEVATCTATVTDEAGPFPTHTPSTLERSNIVGDRTGIPFTINITVTNINNACAVQEGIIVNIWHCDKDGNYSEYGGTQMQQTN